MGERKRELETKRVREKVKIGKDDMYVAAGIMT